MLRLLVLLLLLANAAYFSWSQGMLAAWGFAPPAQTEPQRIAQQIKPEAIRVLASDEARRIEAAAAPKPPECLQAGLFTDAEAATLKESLDAWPSGSWSIEPATEPPRWIVYMGKFTDPAALEKKKAELRTMGVPPEPIANAALGPGISLGGYPTEAAAKQQLEALTQKGVRTAKVVQEKPETKGQMLKLPAVDEAQRGKLDDLKSVLAGKPLKACR